MGDYFIGLSTMQPSGPLYIWDGNVWLTLAKVRERQVDSAVRAALAEWDEPFPPLSPDPRLTIDRKMPAGRNFMAAAFAAKVRHYWRKQNG